MKVSLSRTFWRRSGSLKWLTRKKKKKKETIKIFDRAFNRVHAVKKEAVARRLAKELEEDAVSEAFDRERS